MNVREYFEARIFPNTALESDKKMIARILDSESGAEDGTTMGDVLSEVDVHTPCGLDCKVAIDAAVLFIDASITKAHGAETIFTPTILEAAVDCCVTFIRG